MFSDESWCFLLTQKTAYDVRVSDGSSGVCSSDLPADRTATRPVTVADRARDAARARAGAGHGGRRRPRRPGIARAARPRRADSPGAARRARRPSLWRAALAARARSDFGGHATRPEARSIL